MLNAQTNLSEVRFVLFDQDLDVKKKERERIAAGKFPLVQGNIEIGPRKKPGDEKNLRMNLSAWVIPGQSFLRLTAEEKEQVGENEWRTLRTFTGTLNKGNGDNYFGYISEQFVNETDGKKEYSKGDFEFGFSAVKHPAVVNNGVIEKKAYFSTTKWWDAKANGSKAAANVVADESEADIGF